MQNVIKPKLNQTKQAHGTSAKYDPDNRFYLYKLTDDDLKKDNTPMYALNEELESIFFENIPS